MLDCHLGTKWTRKQDQLRYHDIKNWTPENERHRHQPKLCWAEHTRRHRVYYRIYQKTGWLVFLRAKMWPQKRGHGTANIFVFRWSMATTFIGYIKYFGVTSSQRQNDHFEQSHWTTRGPTIKIQAEQNVRRVALEVGTVSRWASRPTSANSRLRRSERMCRSTWTREWRRRHPPRRSRRLGAWNRRDRCGTWQ